MSEQSESDKLLEEAAKRGESNISEAELVEANEKSNNLGKEKNNFLVIVAMVTAVFSGKYKLDAKTLMIFIGGIAYVISPLDLIPDIIPIVGWLDDAGVVAAVVKNCSTAIDMFIEYQRANDLNKEEE